MKGLAKTDTGLEALISEVMGPPPSRGRRPTLQITACYKRDLNQSDIRALWDLPNGALESTTGTLVKLRFQHHALARLIAEGRPDTESSLITGYDPARISILKRDPAFSSLVQYYKEQVKEVFVNVHERLAALGLNTVEELMQRLDETPDSFTNRELMELAALGLDRSGVGPSSRVDHNHKHSLSPDVLQRLKDELASRTVGAVRALPSNSPGSGSGVIIEHEPLAGTETPTGSEGTRTDV